MTEAIQISEQRREMNFDNQNVRDEDDQDDESQQTSSDDSNSPG